MYDTSTKLWDPIAEAGEISRLSEKFAFKNIIQFFLCKYNYIPITFPESSDLNIFST